MTEAFESTKNYLLSPSQAVRVSKVFLNKKGTVIEQSQALLEGLNGVVAFTVIG